MLLNTTSHIAHYYALEVVFFYEHITQNQFEKVGT